MNENEKIKSARRTLFCPYEDICKIYKERDEESWRFGVLGVKPDIIEEHHGSYRCLALKTHLSMSEKVDGKNIDKESECGLIELLNNSRKK